MTVYVVSESGLPPPATSGIYAVLIPDGLVKFGRSANIAARLVTHHKALKHYGMEFTAAWVPVTNPLRAERDLLQRLKASGFERAQGSEAFLIPWDVALRHLESSALRSETQTN